MRCMILEAHSQGYPFLRLYGTCSAYSYARPTPKCGHHLCTHSNVQQTFRNHPVQTNKAYSTGRFILLGSIRLLQPCIKRILTRLYA